MNKKTYKLRIITMAMVFVVFAYACSSNTSTVDEVNQTPTLLPSPTSTDGVDINLLQYNCLHPTSANSFTGVEGNIATFSEETNKISLWNLSDEPKLDLGRIEILNGASSTHQKIAYIDVDRQEVVVVSAHGEELIAIPAQKNWVEVIDWANGENLLISNMPRREDGGWWPPSSTIILNTINGQYSEVFPDYPNIYSYTAGPPNFGRYSYSITTYDPTLTRVVYPGVTQNDFFITLWDLSTNHETARLQLPSSYYPPQWKYDGTSFIISVPPRYTDFEGKIHNITTDRLPYLDGNDLFSVSRDGEIKRLTFLTTKYKAEESTYVWSPSGKLIAFWLRIENDSHGWQLAVLNIDTGNVESYCVGGGDGSFPIVWSPNEDQIVSTFRNVTNGKLESILVNINKDTAYVIHESGVILGWMDD